MPLVKRSVLFGVSLGIGFGLLRVAKAEDTTDLMIAAGLTVVECVAVGGLGWFAERHRKLSAAYRESQAPIVALERTIADIDAQIAAEESRCAGFIDELKQREAETFDVESIAAGAAWAVEAAYRAAIHKNQRALEGGSLGPLPAPKSHLRREVGD